MCAVRQSVPTPRRDARGPREGPLPHLLVRLSPLVLRSGRLAAGDHRDNTFGEVDRSEHGLIEIPTEERHGFIWVVDNAKADIDVAAWFGPDIDPMLASYHLEDSFAKAAAGFDEPTNWKIMQDAFLDGYHIQYAHPNTAGKIIHTNVMAFEDFGRHCRFIARANRSTVLEEDPGDIPLDKYVTETHFIGPNSTPLRQPDHFQLLTFRPHPLDPMKSRMEQRLFVLTVEASIRKREAGHIWNKNWEILPRRPASGGLPVAARRPARAGQRRRRRHDAGPQRDRQSTVPPRD